MGCRSGRRSYTISASGTTTYQYDVHDELLQEQSARAGGYTNQFAYDAAYNPTTFKGQTNSYNANNQNTNFTFDERGNPLSYKGVSVTWDPENRMTTSSTVMTAGYTAGGIRAKTRAQVCADSSGPWRYNNTQHRTPNTEPRQVVEGYSSRGIDS